MFQNVLCPLCQTHEDTLPNLLFCEELRAVPRNLATHEDIFSQYVDTQRTALIQIRTLMQARERFLDWEEEEEEGQSLSRGGNQ